MAVSLRVPDAVRDRIAKLAEAQDTTAHAFMLEAIREKLEADEMRAAFHAEAGRRLATMRRSGKGIPAAEVFEYLQERVRGAKPPRPKSRKLA